MSKGNTMHIRFIRTLLLAMLFAFVMLGMSAAAFARVGVAIMIAPPALPVYEQPICPGDGYLWTPGYWGWGDDFDDYYWVPGTWIMPPEVGFLWTPGYWGWGDGGFIFNEGYWGPQIGFYGGINYGFGYFGVGFEGGRWDNGHFFYNRAVANINVNDIHNVYNTPMSHETAVNHVSYNGGNGGINARPTSEEEAAGRERHVPAVAAQTQHAQQARSDPQQRASMNQGKPPVAATAKPGEMKGDGVVKASDAGAPYTRAANHGENQPRENGAENTSGRPSTPGHVRDLPPAERPTAPSTGDAKQDQKNQKQLDKQYASQQKERQKLQQKQEKEDQKMTKQNNDAQKQQVEQQHQQQTQDIQQRHQQQQQNMMQSMRAPSGGRPPR
jgi:hypothetical protein